MKEEPKDFSALVEKARELKNNFQLEDAHYYAKKAHLLSEGQETQTRYESLLLLADVCYDLEQWEDAEDWYKKAILLVSEKFGTEDPFVIKPLLRMGLICRALKDYESTEKFYYAAYNIYSDNHGSIEHKVIQELLLELSSIVYFNNKEKALALEFYEEYERFVKDVGTYSANGLKMKKIYFMIYNGILDVVKETLDDLDQEELHKEGYDYRWNYLSGLLSFIETKSHREVKYYESALEIVKKDFSSNEYKKISLLLAASYLRTGKDEEAKALLALSVNADKGHVLELSTGHLKNEGFHFVSALSDEEAHFMRTTILDGAQELYENKSYLSAYILVSCLKDASVVVRGSVQELDCFLEKACKKIPIFSKKIDALSQNQIKGETLV